MTKTAEPYTFCHLFFAKAAFEIVALMCLAGDKVMKA